MSRISGSGATIYKMNRGHVRSKIDMKEKGASTVSPVILRRKNRGGKQYCCWRRDEYPRAIGYSREEIVRSTPDL